ncbi:uncharacterized [Tachysurus ichikawai]
MERIEEQREFLSDIEYGKKRKRLTARREREAFPGVGSKGGKGRKAFDRLLQTRQPRKKLMAMINDKGPEESGDTAATYIIPPHQSEHLPGPSLSLPYLCPLPHSPQLPPSRMLSLHPSFFSPY